MYEKDFKFDLFEFVCTDFLKYTFILIRILVNHRTHYYHELNGDFGKVKFHLPWFRKHTNSIEKRNPRLQGSMQCSVQ